MLTKYMSMYRLKSEYINLPYPFSLTEEQYGIIPKYRRIYYEKIT